MANVVNRTTKQYLVSVNTPDYPTEEWIINPNLSAVQNVDKKYWKIDGDNVVEMTQAEKDVVDLADLPKFKTTRYHEIDTRTQELVAEGFTYSGLNFSLGPTAQTQMMGIHQIKDNPSLDYPITWANIDNSDSYDLVSAADVEAFYLTACGTYRYYADSGNTLKTQIRNETTVSGVNAVVDNR